jgi:hypothetical protein
MRVYNMAMLDAAYVFSTEPIARLREGRASLGTREYRYMHASLPLKDEILALHHV